MKDDIVCGNSLPWFHQQYPCRPSAELNIRIDEWIDKNLEGSDLKFVTELEYQDWDVVYGTLLLLPNEVNL